jgi:hypothetical protein
MFTLSLLYPQVTLPRYILTGTQSQSGRGGEEKNFYFYREWNSAVQAIHCVNEYS